MSDETKHTPGPWQRIGWQPCGIYGPGDVSSAVRIAQLDRRKEHDADAHLIAAAPELLAALSYARNLIGPDEVIDAALAKAVSP